MIEPEHSSRKSHSHEDHTAHSHTHGVIEPTLATFPVRDIIGLKNTPTTDCRFILIDDFGPRKRTPLIGIWLIANRI